MHTFCAVLHDHILHRDVWIGVYGPKMLKGIVLEKGVLVEKGWNSLVCTHGL